MTHAPHRAAQAFESLDDVIELLRRGGSRLSMPRRVILEALFSADGPVSAEQLAGGLGGRFPSLDVTSVYRNLEHLEDLGIVRHVHLGHGPGLYSLAHDPEPEYTICDRCQHVTTLPAKTVAKIRSLVLGATGHAPRFDHFPMHGRCQACLEAMASDEGRPRSASVPARRPR